MHHHPHTILAAFLLGLAVTMTGVGGAVEFGSTAAVDDPGPEVNLGHPDLAPEDYGLNTNVYYVSAEEFTCSDTSGTCTYQRCHTTNYWCSSTAYADVFAAVRLPTGAYVYQMRALYYDNDPAADLSLWLYRGWYWNGSRNSEQLQHWASSGSPGVAESWIDVVPDFTVRYVFQIGAPYAYQSYYLWVVLPPTSAVQLRGVAVYWYRQVSPTPATATFTDVSTGHWAFRHVEALAASGITAGCSATEFCPDATLTRAQMAVFLAKALGLHWAP